MTRMWNTWVPADLAQEIAEEEPLRFKAASAAVCAEVQRSLVATDPDRWSRVLRFIPIINNFLSTKVAFAVGDVHALAQALWTTVLQATMDLETQVRVAQTLMNLVRCNKHELMPCLVLPWRPLYDLLLSLYGDPPPRLEGMGMTTTRQTTLFQLAVKLRRFFPAEATAEVWSLLHARILGVTGCSEPDACEAMGWLSVFMPTHKIDSLDEGQLNGLVGQWMSTWPLVVHSPQWDAMWLSLIARAAKHDMPGRIDWSPHVARIFTHVLGIFHLPVGNATGSVPVGRGMPFKAMMLFMNQMAHEPYHAARAALHLLKHSLDRLDRTHPALALTCLEQLVALMEQYFHPSNSGKWSRPLATLLKHLTAAMQKLLGRQGGSPAAGEARLSADTQERLVALLVRLASAAQFSKDGALSKVSVRALASLSYLSPATVVPVVVRRFRAALETATATHQLASAVTTMALCVRPMLLAEWPGEADEATPQLLAEAIMAVLPGIDANDEAKTTAVLHFYVAVLSNLPRVMADDEEVADGGAPPYRLPLYWDDWADEVLSRILALLQNLDTGPGHRADQAHSIKGDGGGASFLMQGACVYWRLADQMFQKLPLATTSRLGASLSAFVLGNTLSSVATEVSTLVNSFATFRPELADQLLVHPLLDRVLQELDEPGVGAVSQTLEATLQGQVGVLREVVAMRAGDTLLPLLPRLTMLVDRLLAANSKPLHTQGCGVLSVLSMVMCRYHFTFPRADVLPAPQLANGLERWVEKEGRGFKPPAWTSPSPAQREEGERLMEVYLVQAAQELRKLATSGGGGEGSHAHKMALHSTLSKLRGTLNGFLSSLRDFQFDVGGSPTATRVCVIGRITPAVGGALNTREVAAEAFIDACRALAAGGDAETLSLLVSCAGLLLCNGSSEYSGPDSWRAGGRLDDIVGEPAIAEMYQQECSDGSGGPWRRRMPSWVALDRCSHHLTWRSSQAAFRWWATDEAPEMPSADGIPAAFKDLLFEVSQFSTHRYKRVREAAEPIMEAVLKRFPVLVPHHLPTFLAGLADLPAPAATDAARREVLSRIAEGAAASTAAVAPPAADGSAAAGGGDAAAAAAAAAATFSGVDSERDARVIGSCKTLRESLGFWRLIFRDPEYFAATLRAFMSSRTHDSSPSQSAIGNLLVHMASRFVHPPALDYASPLYASLTDQFLALGSPAAAAATPAAVLAAAPLAAAPAAAPGGATWRYALIANVVAVLLVPQPDRAGGAAAMPRFASHLLRLLGSDVVALRELGSAGLQLQLSAVFDYGMTNDGLVDVIDKAAQTDGFGDVLFHLLSHGHEQLDAAEASKHQGGGGGAAKMMSRFGAMSFEDMIVRIVQGSLDRLSRWPEDDKPEAVADGLFMPSHARLVHLLALAAPAPLAAALRGQLERRITGERTQVSNTSDKAEQASCAEAVAGLLAADALAAAPHASSSGNEPAPVSSWLLPLLGAALRSTTLELAGCWAVALRYGLQALLGSAVPSTKVATPWSATAAHLPQPRAAAALKTLLAAVLHSAGGGAGGGGAALPSEMKRLKYMNECVTELSTLTMSDDLPPSVRAFWSGVLDELSVLTSSAEHFSLRERVGELLADTFAYFQVCRVLDTVDAPLGLTAELSGMQVAVEGPAGVFTPLDIAMSDAHEPVAELQSSAADLEKRARTMATDLVAHFQAATNAVQALRSTAEGGAASAATTAAATAVPAAAVAAAAAAEAVAMDVVMSTPGAAAETIVAVTAAAVVDDVSQYADPVFRLGLGLQLVTSVVQRGDLVRLRDLLLALLPDLFRLQELAGLVLQKLHKEAQMAFILLKYVLLDQGTVAPVLLTSVAGTAGADLWSARASGLVFAQYAWFRHALLLGPEDTAQLQLFVVGRLSDPKAEVRAVAAATLSGMLKSTPPAAVAALRSHLVGRTRTLFRKQAPAAAAASAAGTLVERQGCIQGLKAFVMSSPYDCPSWMPDVLMALVTAASVRDPVLRGEVSKALGEFKRTHEQDSLAELRALLEPDQWDALQQVSSTASYFV